MDGPHSASLWNMEKRDDRGWSGEAANTGKPDRRSFDPKLSTSVTSQLA